MATVLTGLAPVVVPGRFCIGSDVYEAVFRQFLSGSAVALLETARVFAAIFVYRGN